LHFVTPKPIRMKKRLLVTVLLLIITVINYFLIIAKGNVRAVEFVSILAIGVLIGVLLHQLISLNYIPKK
jgi:hypothetical protein